MTPIPLVILEEHHEAFILWHHAVRGGWMGPAGNVLLHADVHADMRLPAPGEAAPPPDAELADVAAWVYERLDIAAFIRPALARGLFRRVYWLRRRHDARLKVRTFGPADGSDAWGALTPGAGVSNEIRAAASSAVEWIPLTERQVFTESGPVVLDIDLDYFASDDRTGGTLDIPVTRAVHDTIRRDRYHRLRLLLGGRFQLVRVGRRHFIRLVPGAASAKAEAPHPEEVRRRVATLGDFLAANRVSPGLIGICRSVRSGYTPMESGRVAEEALLEVLGDLYPLNARTIDEVLRPSGPP